MNERKAYEKGRSLFGEQFEFVLEEKGERFDFFLTSEEYENISRRHVHV